MIKSTLAFINLALIQSVHPPAPVEAKMGPAPPVGDVVPLDNGLIFLFIVALCIGSFVIYKRVKVVRS